MVPLTPWLTVPVTRSTAFAPRLIHPVFGERDDPCRLRARPRALRRRGDRAPRVGESRRDRVGDDDVVRGASGGRRRVVRGGDVVRERLAGRRVRDGVGLGQGHARGGRLRVVRSSSRAVPPGCSRCRWSRTTTIRHQPGVGAAIVSPTRAASVPPLFQMPLPRHRSGVPPVVAVASYAGRRARSSGGAMTPSMSKLLNVTDGRAGVHVLVERLALDRAAVLLVLRRRLPSVISSFVPATPSGLS